MVRHGWGALAIVTLAQEVYTYELPAEGETIQIIAVDEEGICRVDRRYLSVSDKPATKEPYYTWREDYDNGAVQNQAPSPTALGPQTLIGDDLVAIADDGDPFTNIVVYKKSASIKGERLICESAFGEGKSATENSLLVYRQLWFAKRLRSRLTGNALKHRLASCVLMCVKTEAAAMSFGITRRFSRSLFLGSLPRPGCSVLHLPKTGAR